MSANFFEMVDKEVAKDQTSVWMILLDKIVSGFASQYGTYKVRDVLRSMVDTDDYWDRTERILKMVKSQFR